MAPKLLWRRPIEPSIQLPADIDRALVEACISRKDWRLAFPPRLEAWFEQENGPRRCRSLVRMGILGLVVLQTLLLPLWLTIGDVFARMLWVQLGVVTPLSLLLLGLVLRRPPAFLREMCIVAVVVLATAGIIAVTLTSNSPGRWAVPQLYILSFLYVSALQRLRFIPAVIACALFVLSAVVLLSGLPQYDGRVFAASLWALVAASAFALCGTYMAERQMRLSYLYSLLTRLQNAELDRISRFDPLTGLGNRRLLDETVHQCRSEGRVSCLTMLMIDLDHFKKLNDALGHQAGDRCLVRVAGLVQGALRDHRDHAFRYGGEEFLVLLQDASRETASAVAERIRAAIEAAGIPNPGLLEGATLTASLGLATGAFGSAADAERLVANADAALYAAKRAGRNQVAWHRS